MSKEETIILNLKRVYNLVYKSKKGPTFRNIFRTVYGDDYPEESNPDSYVTFTDLRNVVRYLNVGAEETFIDLGCGRGGPGMWVAREIGAKYIGLDLSESAVKSATQRIKEYGLEGRATFQVGNISATNFPDNRFDGAISIDALFYLPDLRSGIKEVARILRSDANFLLTSWEPKDPNSKTNYSAIIKKAGFEIELYNEPPDWERLQREAGQKIVESKKILIKEMGKEAAVPWIMDAMSYLRNLEKLKRIFIVAKKV